MRKHRRTIGVVIAAVAGIAIVASVALAGNGGHRGLNGTIWVANRGTNTIRGFDAATGSVVASVAMAAGSQPGDLAYAKGKLYVSEEFGFSAGNRDCRRQDGRGAEADRHASRVATTPRARERRWEPRLGRPLRDRHGGRRRHPRLTHCSGPGTPIPTTTNGRAPTRASSRRTDRPCGCGERRNRQADLRPRSPPTGELFWRVPTYPTHMSSRSHTTARPPMSRDGLPRTRYGSSTSNDTSSQGQSLSGLEHPPRHPPAVGERKTAHRRPAREDRAAVGRSSTPQHFTTTIVTIGGPGTIAGHQMTSPNGHFTFAAFEGPDAGRRGHRRPTGQRDRPDARLARAAGAGSTSRDPRG